MNINMKKMVLLAVAQSAKGTPGTPLPGTNAILCKGLMPTLIKGKFLERDNLRGFDGANAQLFGGEHRVFDFEVEAAGSGAAGTAPAFDALMLGCRNGKTVSAGVSVAYAPVEGDGSYLTLYGYLDGLLFKMTDALGTMGLKMTSGELPMLKFTFTGNFLPMEDATFVTGAVYTGFTKPKTVSAANTTTWTLDALALVTKSFELDTGIGVSWRDWINSSGATNQERKASAKAVFEMTSVATKDWADAVLTGDEMALAITHGTTAGNIFTVAAPKLSFNAEPTLGNEAGIAVLNGSFGVLPNTGNDEYVLTFM
jgi:hypothetical protein